MDNLTPVLMSVTRVWVVLRITVLAMLMLKKAIYREKTESAKDMSSGNGKMIRELSKTPVRRHCGPSMDELTGWKKQVIKGTPMRKPVVI